MQREIANLEHSWKAALKDEFEKPYMHSLQRFLDEEEEQATVYPPKGERFQALNLTPLDEVKVVILGQDPYHGPDQAQGLCFSVRTGIKVPPSLVNIYKALQKDLGIVPPAHGDLSHWARQGVLLLNAVLTVRECEAGSHRKQGWERFTDRIIEILNERHRGLVFLLWGSYAQQKAGFVDTDRHLVLEAPHPSPLSAHRGFFDCHHFSKANHYLAEQGEKPIDWHLPERP